MDVGDIVPEELWYGASFCGQPYVEIVADGPTGYGVAAETVSQFSGGDCEFQEGWLYTTVTNTGQQFSGVIESNADHGVIIRDYETEQAYTLDAIATETDTSAYEIHQPRPDMPDDKLRHAGLREIPDHPGWVGNRFDALPGDGGILSRENLARACHIAADVIGTLSFANFGPQHIVAAAVFLGIPGVGWGTGLIVVLGVNVLPPLLDYAGDRLDD